MGQSERAKNTIHYSLVCCLLTLEQPIKAREKQYSLVSGNLRSLTRSSYLKILHAHCCLTLREEDKFGVVRRWYNELCFIFQRLRTCFASFHVSVESKCCHLVTKVEKVRHFQT